MKSIPKLIRRYVGILLLSCVLLFILNIVLLYIFTMRQAPNASPWKTAEEAAKALERTEEDKYCLPDTIIRELKGSGVWAIFIDNETKEVRWQTDNLPETIPMYYTISDIASLTRGYIDDYPTFTGYREDGLVVLGYPKDSYWKHMWPSWDYGFIENFPRIALSILAINGAVIFIIYMAANTRLIRSVKPIVDGIQGLPLGEPVYVKERGLLSELAVSINKTSEILVTQNNQLRRKETARANWIAGVSHDIRTPLSMVMGYAGQLTEDSSLSKEQRRKAVVILKQSEKMRSLISDLNLASKLEYNMQPLHLKTENMVAIVRQVVVDFINMAIDDKHPIEWEAKEGLNFCPVNADKDLMKRAIGNLIQNSIIHNEQGCKIYVKISRQNSEFTIAVEDNGIGAADEKIERLNLAPHYMVCDENAVKQRHGLGLLIVKQIGEAHGGSVIIGHSDYGGFCVKIILPVKE